MAIDYVAGGRLRKLRLEEAWETIEDLAQHKREEEWNDPFFFEKGSPDYIDATLELELESMEYRVETLMRNEVLFEYEEFLKKENVFFTDPGDGVRINPDGVARPAIGKFDFI
ncbi:hypothetical protein Tco_1342222 [Tanacetum coccineum]